jgi:hypothetical protein
MLKIKLVCDSSRPKGLIATEYEYSNGVVFPEHLKGKMYYNVAQVDHDLGDVDFYIYIGRKFNATDKLTGQEIKVKGGKFYKGSDDSGVTDSTKHIFTLSLTPLLRYHHKNTGVYKFK